MATLLSWALRTTPALASHEAGVPVSSPFSVTADQLLRGRVKDASLPDILREIGRVTGMDIVGTPANCDKQVSLGLDAVPVVDAVRRLMRDCNYMMTVATSDGVARVVRLTIFGGENDTRVDPPQAVIEDEDLGDVAPAEIGRLSEGLEIVSMLADDGDAGTATEALREMFDNDSESLVRQAALTRLGEKTALSAEELLDVALKDADESVRLRSIELLPSTDVSDPAVYDALARLASDEINPMSRAVIESAMREIQAKWR